MKLYFCPNCNDQRGTVRRTRLEGVPGRIRQVKRRLCLVCRNVVQPGPNKYNAKPALGTTGKLRHSSSEAAYEAELAWMQKAGEIEDLRLCNDVPRETYNLEVFGTPQVRELLEFLESDDEVEGTSTWLPRPLQARLRMLLFAVRTSLAKIATYTPDFSFRPKGQQQRKVVDLKGYITQDFSLKRKLMRAVHGVDVEIVRPERRRVHAVR